MIDFQQIDVTPLPYNQGYVQEYRDKGRTSFLSDVPSAVMETAVRGKSMPTFRRGSDSTATAADRQRIGSSYYETAPAELDRARSVIERASEARLALLAQKYEGTATKEDSARLAILTERIRRLCPRVTPADLAALGEVVGEIEQITVGIEQLRQEFGI